MERINPTEMYRTKGTPNSVVLLVDRSSSMDGEQLRIAHKFVQQTRAIIPQIRVLVFWANVVDVTGCKDPYDKAPGRGRWKSGGSYTNCTYLAGALSEARRYRPERTIVISDGGVADRSAALRQAWWLSGTIDAYYCPSTWDSRSTMEELARVGKGEMLHGPLEKALPRALHVIRGRDIRVEHREPEFVRQGQPVSQAVRTSQTTVRVVPGGTVRLTAQQALPAPQRTPATFQIEHKPEIPVAPVKKKSWIW